LTALARIEFAEARQGQEQGRIGLTLKCEPYKHLQERPDLTGVHTELPADSCRTTWKERVCRRHAG
jgi:hypothetical protein